MCIRILPSEVETRQQSSSGMIIPVLELITLHFGKGHVSELNNLNNRPYNAVYTRIITRDIRLHGGQMPCQIAVL